jgi:two-component system cell cycle sensor histidine kinase/response regulator CckA
MTNTKSKTGKAALVFAFLTIGIGITVLSGWTFDLDDLKSFVPGMVGMNPLTAITFILAGSSLALSLRSASGKPPQAISLMFIARSCAILVAIIGLIKLTGYLCGYDIGIDQYLFASKLSAGEHPHPNRLAPNTALSFLLLGIAFTFVNARNVRVRGWLQLLVVVLSFNALLAILGYAYNVSTLYDFRGFSSMSLVTGISFLIMCAGYFLSQTDRGLPAILTGESAAGLILRRFLPSAILIPAAIGWITLQGEKAGYYEYGEIIFVIGTIAAFFGFICWSSLTLFRIEGERNEAEASLRLLNSAVIQAKESILITTAGLNLPGPEIVFTNPAFTRMTGYSAEESLGKTPRFLQGPLTDRKVLDELRRKLEAGEEFKGETINYRKDGKPFDLEWQIAPVKNVTERKRMEARYRRLVDSNAQGVIFWDKTGKITVANDAFLTLVGYTRQDLVDGLIDWVKLTPPEQAGIDQRALEEISRRGFSSLHEKEYIRKDGSRVPILYGAASFEDSPDEGVCFFLDLTERKAMEERLFQSQKMETVGKLAGGIAHEFNSILTAIIGQSELMQHDLGPNNPLIKNATEINKAAVRAAALTRQILAYGRKQILTPESLDLNSVLSGMTSTLEHLMGSETNVRVAPAVGLKMVKVDAGQIEQVIVNMALNARDAMPHGGKLTLETHNVSFNAESIGRYPELKLGDYVMLAITDTGTGMTPEVLKRIFEPFFSTKGVGQGTGLGLSTCYGIIKQSGGHISAYAEPARGTVLKIYLPQVASQPHNPTRLDSPNLPQGTETILIAEDDPSLLEMSAALLRRLGYTVLTAENGIKALELKQQRETGHIDLLLTDVVMPHMSGKELSDRIKSIYPTTRVLFTSAYAENAILHQGILSEGIVLLQKPFTPSMLAKKVREVLDHPSATL